jgi:pimeloyl-ACP methyl ester carboxylesterase
VSKLAVLVPGIMGSELRLGDEVIWPGSVWSLIRSYDKMDQLLDDRLTPTDVIRSVSVSRQYGSLIEDLGECGFRETSKPPTLFVFPYDWRKDNRQAAEKLADFIDAALVAHGGDADISIVAHSMGGLIARYYLESGRLDSRPGLRAISRLITLGTPHRGSPVALTAAVGEERRLWLSEKQVLQIASDERYPSLYQLLPPRDEPFVWDESPSAELGYLDPYADEMVAALHLVPRNLRAALDFQAGLNGANRPTHIRYFCFAGTRQPTVTAVWLLRTAGRLRLRQLLADDSGDGTVPIWSGSLIGTQGRPVGGEHATIYRNGDLRRTMAALLGAPGVLATRVEEVEVAVRERVVEPEAPMRLTLSFPMAMDQLKGELRLSRAQIDPQGSVTEFRSFGESRPIRYEGLGAETLGIVLTAPEVTGIYRITYHDGGQEAAAGADEVFVQEPPE